MKIVTVGMRPQEAAALDLLVGKTMTGWTCQSLAALPDLAHASPDRCVLDLPGLGMHRFSTPAATQLLQALAGVPAILLTSQHDHSWSAVDDCKPGTQTLALVRKPTSAQTMRAALEHIVTATARVQAPALQAAPVTAAPGPAEMPRPVAHDEPPDAGEIDPAAFASRVEHMDATTPTLFLRKLAEALASNTPFEVRLTLQHCLLVCPQEHWMASNTPMAVIHRLARSDALAAAAHIHSVHSDAGVLLAKHANMSIQPLDTFLWDLLHPNEPGHLNDHP